MNLLEQAEQDLAFTLEDKDNGFGVALTFIDNEKEYAVIANVSDVGYFLDPQTGVGVAARQVEITVRKSTLILQTLGDDPDTTWKAKFIDKNNEEWLMSIVEVRPDRTLGVYNITLEAYNDSED
jgi:outer membrane protease